MEVPPERSLSHSEGLLRSFLELERARVERGAALDSKRAELELRRVELDVAEMERIGTEKRKQSLFDDQRRELKRKSTEVARQAKAAKRLEAQNGPAHGQEMWCEECAAIREHRSPNHSSDLIRHANENHWPVTNRGN